MFQNLKNKIIIETGQDPSVTTYRASSNRSRHSMSSHNSLSIDELTKSEEVRKNIAIFHGFFHKLIIAERRRNKFLKERAGEGKVNHRGAGGREEIPRELCQGWSGAKRDFLRRDR